MSDTFGSSLGGQNAAVPITDRNIQIFSSISRVRTPKLVYKGFVTLPYVHSIGHVPMVFAFSYDDAESPSYFSPVYIPATDTQVGYNEDGASVYLLLFE